MNTIFIHFIRKSYFLVFVILFIFSCQIEDEHGTFKFAAGLGDLDSQHGELIGEFFLHGSFFTSERFRSIYFVGCQSSDSWCSELALFAINYETSESKELYRINTENADISIVYHHIVDQKLFFVVQNHSSNQTTLFYTDLESGISKEVGTREYFDHFRVFVGAGYIYYNYDYHNFSIYQVDFDGNEQLLDLQGELLLAFPEIEKLLLRNPTNGKVFIYDLNINAIEFESTTDLYTNDFYVNQNDIYFLDNSGLPSITVLKTNEILFETAQDYFLLDFNPVCMKSLFIHNETISSNTYYNLNSSSLIIQNNLGQLENTPITVYEEWIDFAKILNDGQTIIYVTMEGKIYKTTIE